MHSSSQARPARIVAGLVTSLLAVALLSLVLMPVGATAQSSDPESEWIARLWGITTEKATRVGTDPETEFHSLSITRTEGQAKLFFDVAPDGSIVDRGGEGLYHPDPTWHLEGSYDGKSFNCDPPVTGTSNGTTIAGTMIGSEFRLTFDLPDWIEHNDQMECGENFTAFATDSTDLRDSLLFCGEARVGVADVIDTNCKKTQIYFEDMSSPTVGRIKREITHDWWLQILNRNAEGQSPSPAPTASPSPSPSPEPRPSPTESGPSTNVRTSLLILEKHLKASGAVVLVGWGDADCVASVPVKLQRKRPNGSWGTVANVTTDEAGMWSKSVGDKSGRYRALAPEVVKGQATCNKATSATKRHRHRK